MSLRLKINLSKSSQRDPFGISTDSIPAAPTHNFGARGLSDILAFCSSTEIETLRLNPSPRRTPNDFGLSQTLQANNPRNRWQCAHGAMRALRKRQVCGEDVCEPFSPACVVREHRAGSDSEKLSLLLSLASEKEGELDQ